jgi:hypothetical protein
MAKRYVPLLLYNLDQNTWKIVVRSFKGCPVADLTFYPDSVFKKCKAMQDAFFDEVKIKRPDLVLMMDQRLTLYGNAKSLLSEKDLHYRAWDSTLRYLKRFSKQIFLLGPAPELSKNFSDCVLSDFSLDSRCNGSASLAFNLVEMERRAAANNNVDFTDVYPWFCKGKKCPPVIGDVIVYLDAVHPTNAMVKQLASLFTAKLRQLGKWPESL